MTEAETKAATKALARDLVEERRLRGLSNEQLVTEILDFKSYDDADLHIEQMCSRLWPEWTNERS